MIKSFLYCCLVTLFFHAVVHAGEGDMKKMLNDSLIKEKTDKLINEIYKARKSQDIPKTLTLVTELCNMGKSSESFLIEKLGEEDELVVDIAGDILTKLNNPTIVITIVNNIENGFLRRNFVYAVGLVSVIGASNKMDIMPILHKWMDSYNKKLVAATIDVCGDMLLKEFLHKIAEKNEDSNEEVQNATIRTLLKIGHPKVIPYLIKDLERLEKQRKRESFISDTDKSLVNITADQLVSTVSRIKYLCGQDFEYNIFGEVEQNQVAISKLKNWWYENKSYLYHHSIGKLAVNEEAKALKIPVNPETGKMIDPKDSHELTPQEIEQIKKSKGINIDATNSGKDGKQ